MGQRLKFGATILVWGPMALYLLASRTRAKACHTMSGCTREILTVRAAPCCGASSLIGSKAATQFPRVPTFHRKITAQYRLIAMLVRIGKSALSWIRAVRRWLKAPPTVTTQLFNLALGLTGRLLPITAVQLSIRRRRKPWT